jgi:hypothetical protein
MWIAMGVLLAAGAVYALQASLGSGALVPISVAIAAAPDGGLPLMPEKPPASPEGFDGCPPEGVGGDARLNLLLNRVDKGAYVPISLDSLMALTWPKSVEGRMMSEWTRSGEAFVAQYLGIPVAVEGFIEALREGGAEPANCNRENDRNPLWRLHLVRDPKDRRAEALVAMSTPQTRLGHTWTADFLRTVVIAGRRPVRVSGWLYFNPDPVHELGRTRGTLWEISPVLQIEVFEDGRWNPLDRYGK